MGSLVNSIIGGVSGNAGGAGMNFTAGSAPITNPFGTAAQAQQQVAQGQNNINGNLAQLQGIANGTGPNPAQTMLNQSTGQNVANQAALMAGQRGSNANVGLMARQASQQGANIQQQAAGQGATLQANQQLGAINQYGQLAQGNQSENMNAIGQLNNANVSNMASQNSANAGVANTVAGGQMGMLSGAVNGAMSMMKAQGGLIRGYADGGDINGLSSTPVAAQTAAKPGPMSRLGQSLQSSSAANPQAQSQSYKDGQSLGNGIAKGLGQLGSFAKDQYNQYQMANPGQGAMDAGSPASAIGSPAMGLMQAAAGGKVPALVSPGEKYLNPNAVNAVAQGASPMQVGETIPGKPKVSGAKNSYANDTVPKTLDEGGIVLPRSVTQSKNPEWAAHKFVRQVMAKKGRGI